MPAGTAVVVAMRGSTGQDTAGYTGDDLATCCALMYLKLEDARERQQCAVIVTYISSFTLSCTSAARSKFKTFIQDDGQLDSFHRLAT